MLDVMNLLLHLWHEKSEDNSLKESYRVAPLIPFIRRIEAIQPSCLPSDYTEPSECCLYYPGFIMQSFHSNRNIEFGSFQGKGIFSCESSFHK